MYIVCPSVAVLRCIEIADAAGLYGIAFSCSGESAEVQSANCSFDDGRQPQVPCKLGCGSLVCGFYDSRCIMVVLCVTVSQA